MALIEINGRNEVMLPVSIMKKYWLEPGSKLELRDKKGTLSCALT